MCKSPVKEIEIISCITCTLLMGLSGGVLKSILITGTTMISVTSWFTMSTRR